MTLLQLKYFQTLAFVLHYTKASEVLHISQPSLSYAIAELEKELGIELFEKKGRKIALTQYGKQFLPYVEKALALLSEGCDKIKHASNQEAKIVRLGYFYSISSTFIPEIINKIYQNAKDLDLSFHFSQELSENIKNMLENNQIDLGFTMHNSDKLEYYPVLIQQLYLVVPQHHFLSVYDDIDINTFLSEPLIALDQASNLRSIIDKLYHEHNTIPNVAFEVKECNAALQFIIQGLGISILPHVPAIDALPVKYIRINDTKFKRTIYLAWPKNKLLSETAAAVKKFIISNYHI
ncbi:MAG: LysR family transcriptional regulator [Acidaminococcaceae bacterium]|nr:LysR family transcriptional regulator [Acidaminococcaceae bacterium]